MPVSIEGLLSPLAEAMWGSPAVPVALLTGDGSVVAANSSFLRLAGIDPVGRPLSDFVCEPHHSALAQCLARMSGEREPGCIGMFPDSDGNPMDASLTITQAAYIEVVIEPHVTRPIAMLAEVVVLNDLLADTQRELRARNDELSASLDQIQKSHLYIRKLEGILPICMNCRSVRDDSDDWTSLDSYLVERQAVSLSHSLCPDCAESFLEEKDVS